MGNNFRVEWKSVRRLDTYMIIGFRYRIVETYSHNNVELYFPEFKVVYSKYDIRNILNFWKPFIEKKYGSTPNKFGFWNHGYYLYDLFFYDKQAAIDFVSQFPKEWTTYNSSVSPLIYNFHQKKLFKTKVEDV